MTRRRATLVALALLAAVVGISAGVGFAARGEGFDWGVASIFGTALGTTLLAVSTLALAYSTWQDVRASQQIAEVTGRSLNLAEAEREERLRPAVLGTVREVNLHPPPDVRPFMDILLHNVGGGLRYAWRLSPNTRVAGWRSRPRLSQFYFLEPRLRLVSILTRTSLRASLGPRTFASAGTTATAWEGSNRPLSIGSTTSWSPASDAMLA